MQELQVLNNSKTLDSREVAEMMGKKHKEILQYIEGRVDKNGNPLIVGIIPVLLSEGIHPVNYFIESTYKDRSGKENKCYLVTKMGCEMLGNKLQGEKGILFTAKYVERFNQMEQALKELQPTPSYMIEDPIERAKAWIKEQEKVKVLETQSEYLKKILESTTTVTMTQIAKDYGMTAQEMNSLLHRLKVQYKQNDQWLLYSKYHKEGYVDSETIPIKHKSGIIEPKMYTKWTQKGRKFLYELLKENEILPVIEREDM